MATTVKYSDKFQRNYEYEISKSVGKGFDPEFRPDLTPAQMLSLGVFSGAYFKGVPEGIPSDLPKSWFKGVTLSTDGQEDRTLNYFKVSASQSREEWQQKGWIHKQDPHGWFQWYCRYYLGRRTPKEDARQINRWKAINRHLAQIVKNCRKGDTNCRPRQRQAVLHWAYDSRKL